MPTPILYGDYLYVGNNMGILTCYEAKSGKQVYEQHPSRQILRLADRRRRQALFHEQEGDMRVVKAGPQFELLATNPIGERHGNPGHRRRPAPGSHRVRRHGDRQAGRGRRHKRQDAAADAKQKAIEAEWKLRNGTWEPAGAVIDGKEPSPQRRRMVLVYKDEHYMDKVGDKIVGEGLSKIDPTQNPKTLDIIPERNGKQGKTAFAIYETQGR